MLPVFTRTHWFGIDESEVICMMLPRRLRSYALVLLLASWPGLATGQAAGPLPPDIRLLIDVSGSMKQNDPNNLRQPAVDLLVQLLPDNGKAGVWTFGRWVNMLVKHQAVDAAWREEARAKAAEINSVGLFTNIGEALEKAAYDLSPARRDFRSSIILLTDGMVDIDKDPAANKREWRRIVDEVLPRLQAAGVSVHTIALSDKADSDLLNKLSLGTDGIAAVAKNADALMKIFLQAFEVAAPMEQVPLSDDGFVIDSSVEEFTALIFRQQHDQDTQLVGPDREALTARSRSNYVNWHRADTYDLITVKQPLEGQWRVIAAMAPDSRITVVSNLNLRVRPLPNNVLKGQQESLSLLLQEDGKTVVRPEFLSLMEIDAGLQAGGDEFDLREIWRAEIATAAPPSDGVFATPLPAFAKEGIYQLSVVLDGKSFVREFNHQFTVRQPFGADIKPVFVDGATEYLLTARAYDKSVVESETQVVATIIYPDRRKKIRPLSPTDLDTWQTSVRPEVEGAYLATIKMRGVTEDGGSFDIALEPLQFNYSIDAGFVAKPKPFFDAPQATPTPQVTPEPEPETNKPETKPTPPPELQADAAETGEQAPAIPPWMLYVILGVGNLLLLGLGFFAFKKIIGGGNKEEEILQQFSDAEIARESQDATAQEASVSEDEEEIEEEPPMEDIDPAEDASSESEGMPMDTSMMAPDPDPEPEPDPAPESEPELQPEPEPEPMDALDDLEQMAVEAEAAVDDEEEDGDMVAAMLKAQGLDLAEDELDDAISSLIDELENDDSLGEVEQDSAEDKKEQ